MSKKHIDTLVKKYKTFERIPIKEMDDELYMEAVKKDYVSFLNVPLEFLSDELYNYIITEYGEYYECLIVLKDSEKWLS